MKQASQKSLKRSKMGWAAGLAIALLTVPAVGAQSNDGHGRKWKPLPTLAHIVVTVVKGFDGKPMPNAAVVFHATMNGRDDGNLEVKTDPEGRATIDVIEVGSKVTMQVIATGFATYAQDVSINGPTKMLDVKLVRPREQVSQYENNLGGASEAKPGIQEPPHPVLPPAKPAGNQSWAPPPNTPAPPTGSPQ